MNPIVGQIWERTNETVPMGEVTFWFPDSGKFYADLEGNFSSVELKWKLINARGTKHEFFLTFKLPLSELFQEECLKKKAKSKNRR